MNVDIHVAEQLARALQPSVANVSIKWNTSQRILHQAPEQAPPVFFGDRLLAYALLDETTPFDHTTTVELSVDASQPPIGSARIDHIPPVLDSRAITRLAAKALLRELTDVQKSTDKQAIIDTSLTYGILCPYTAFIGIEKRLNANSESNADMELREIPLMTRNTSRQYLQSVSRMQNRLCMASSTSSSSIIDKIDMLDMQASALHCIDHQVMCTQSYKCSYMVKRRAMSFNPIGSITRPVTSFFSSLFAKTENTRRHTSSNTGSADRTIAPTRDYSHRSSSNSSVPSSQISNSVWPTEEQKLVDRFIDLQRYDGLWALTEDDVKQLTGQSFTTFTSSVVTELKQDDQRSVIVTAIVLVILETRCSSLKTLWLALSNKAKNRVKELLKGDQTKLEQLMKDIQKQLQP